MASSTTTKTSTSSFPTKTSNERDTKIVKDALYRIRNSNHIPSEVQQSLITFQVDEKSLGKVTPPIANLLVQSQDDVFELHQREGKSILTLSESCGTTCNDRSAAVASVTKNLKNEGKICGWRDELYPVAESFYDEPVFVMERAAVPFVGALEYGVHINGLVQNDDKNKNNGETMRMWMARRSATKSKYPNMLDHIVAGGQPTNMSLMENVVKECFEEAGIPEDMTRAGIRPVGAISYETYSSQYDTISRAVMFNYDLFLPSSFQPTPMDGEVQEFFLWTVDEIVESMDPFYGDPLKTNCYLVVIDWLVREGHVSADVPGYLDIIRELRSGDCR